MIVYINQIRVAGWIRVVLWCLLLYMGKSHTHQSGYTTYDIVEQSIVSGITINAHVQIFYCE